MPIKKEKWRASSRARLPQPPLRVSVVKYLNTAPLIWGLQRAQPGQRFHLNFTVPADCADDLRAGRADIGIIPSIEYQTIPGLKVIPRIAIAGQRKIESVLLVSRGPARRAKRVALDKSSRTSAALVKILFAHLWKVEPEYEDARPDLQAMLVQADAALLIGDPALRFALHAPPPFSPADPLSRAQSGGALPREAAANLHVYDLAEEWWRLTQLPFVFAFWAVRAETGRSPQERRRLAKVFRDSRDAGLAHLEEIARQAAGELALSGGQLERYLRHSIDYRLDAPQRAGLESFYRYAHELGLIERVKAVEFL
ncbi:MAG: menaquinone biosynthetic enzyme MqnA/MqnD family protein [Terriglobia bacterium]